MSKERVVVLDSEQKINLPQNKINYTLLDEQTKENASLKKELVIVFENDDSKINIIPNTIDYDLSDKIKVGEVKITNEDGTLIISSKGTTTNINTNIIQRYNTHYEFPNRGKPNVLYIDLEESSIYYWENNEYMKLSDYNDIKIINGGEA